MKASQIIPGNYRQVPERRSFKGSFFVLVASCMALAAVSISAQAKQWVGTWAAAPYAAGTNTPPSPYLANNTLRQIVRVSIGGDTLRVKFSNGTALSPVTINSVNIAVSPNASASAITASTIKQLRFGGNASVTMAAGATATSDPVAFSLTPSMRLAITIYYGQCQIAADMTHHYGSRTNSYILTGDQTANAAFTGATAVERWYHINSIEVFADSAATHAVVCLGNSITDGYGLTGGLENRWTDMFSQALLNNAPTAHVGVLNMGIGGTNVAGTGATTGATRFQQDVLNQSGVKWVIIFYGINDICASNSTAATVTSAYQTMITAAHAQNMKVYGATITPVNGNTYYTPAHEAVRAAVNTWIRTPGHFDAYIDFDHTIRNPADTTRLQAAYSNDWLHPNAAGYKLLGESIDLNLFVLNTRTMKGCAENSDRTGVKLLASYCNGKTMVTFEIPGETFVSLKAYSLLGKEIAELAGRRFSSGRHTVEFKSRNHAKGMYFCSLKIDKIYASQIMIYSLK
jgi:lysophospholipase L1-like esterase